METRTKVIIFRVILVLVGVLFVAGYFHQRQLDQQQTSKTKESSQEQKIESNETFTPFGGEEKKEESGENSTVVSPNAGKKLADFYSSEDIQNSKKVAADFSKNYYPIDGKELDKSVKNSIPYVTENLKRMMQTEEGMARPAGDFFSRKLREISVEEPSEASPDAITLNVKVQGDIENEKGKVTARDTTTYLLQIIREKDSFRVAEFAEETNE